MSKKGKIIIMKESVLYLRVNCELSLKLHKLKHIPSRLHKQSSSTMDSVILFESMQ